MWAAAETARLLSMRAARATAAPVPRLNASATTQDRVTRIWNLSPSFVQRSGPRGRRSPLCHNRSPFRKEKLLASGIRCQLAIDGDHGVVNLYGPKREARP